jgi:hypothetical protein
MESWNLITFRFLRKLWMHKELHKGGVYSSHVHTWIYFSKKLG